MNDCIVAFHKLFNVRNSEGKSVSSDRFCDLRLIMKFVCLPLQWIVDDITLDVFK